jgi:AhpD family alkylhydroperoxidase
VNSNYQHPLSLPATDAAPEESKTILEGVKKKFGFVPNLMTAFSPSPAVLEAYLVIADLVSKTSFTPKEQHAGALIISQEFDCHYCLAAHGTLGKSLGLDKETIVALQTRAPLTDSRLGALRTLLLSLIETRGHPEPKAIKKFREAGYTDVQLGEAVLLITWKTLSNYTNHLYDTPIDEPFKLNAAPSLVGHLN